MDNFTRDRPHCGDIWMCSLPKQTGSVQYGYRPVLVISNDLNNTYALTINVIPISSSTKKKHLPIHVDIANYKECGLDRPCRLLVEQTTTVSVDKFVRYVGHISSPALIERISEAVRLQFQILRM